MSALRKPSAAARRTGSLAARREVAFLCDAHAARAEVLAHRAQVNPASGPQESVLTSTTFAKLTKVLGHRDAGVPHQGFVIRMDCE